MKVLPKLDFHEKDFCREILAGRKPADAWGRAYLTDEEIDEWPYTRRRDKSEALLNKPHIQEFIEYMRTVTPEQLFTDNYLSVAAFGEAKDQMNAAKSYLESQVAGKDIAHIFLDTLHAIQAEILIPCGGHVDKVTLG